MPDREKVIKGLNDIGGFIAGRIGIEQARNFLRTIDDAIELLKEQEELIPASWLKEKLEGHPELPYAVTDGINNVLDLWERR